MDYMPVSFWHNALKRKTPLNFVPVAKCLHLNDTAKSKEPSVLTQFAILRISLSSHFMIRRQQPLIDHLAWSSWFTSEKVCLCLVNEHVAFLVVFFSPQYVMLSCFVFLFKTAIVAESEHAVERSAN